MRIPALSLPILAAALGPAPAAFAQTGAVRPDTLLVRPGEAPLPSVSLGAGERIAVWIESDIEVGERDAGPAPVQEAAVGEVIARWGSGAFAWPPKPHVWIAPTSGALAFDVNARPAHRARGAAEVRVLRLGPVGAGPPPGFEPPILQLDRVPGGVRARWVDRGGFGIEPATLALELTTSHGTVYELGPWVRPGPDAVTLPLPPPGLALPPGVHTLRATVADRLGVRSPAATLRFDSP